MSEIKRESDFDSKTKIVGIKIPICKRASLLSHIIPDIKSYIPLGSYGCGQKSGKWEIKLYFILPMCTSPARNTHYLPRQSMEAGNKVNSGG